MTQKHSDLRLFAATHFTEYLSWYADAELNDQLGPMDDEWLDFVLTDQEGRQFSYLEDGRLSAVIGVAPDPDKDVWVVTDLAVNPALRRHGIGRRALTAVTEYGEFLSRPRWLAYVMSGNPVAHRFFTAQGWQCVAGPEGEDGMYSFRRDLADGTAAEAPPSGWPAVG